MDIVERMKNGEKISIGMIHTLPLPGSFRNTESMDTIIDRAVQDAVILENAGFDAVIVENINDGPYDDHPMTFQKAAAIAVICSKVKEKIKIPVGIDTCGNQIAGFDIGSVTGVSFIRVSQFVDIRVSARGIAYPNSGNAVMTRKRLGAENIKIFADIQVKHSYPLIGEISLEESAKWAVANAADVIIVTGAETGVETSIDALGRVKKIVNIPVVAGSGVTKENVKDQYSVCDGAIIGSTLKKDKGLMSPIEQKLAEEFTRAVKFGGGKQ